MARRSIVVGWVLVFVAVIGITWAFDVSARSFPYPNGKIYYENISRQAPSVVLRTAPSGDSHAQAVAFSFQLDDWTPVTSGGVYEPKKSTYLKQVQGSSREWGSALLGGLISIGAGLALMFVGGVRLPWM